MKATCTRKS